MKWNRLCAWVGLAANLGTKGDIRRRIYQAAFMDR